VYSGIQGKGRLSPKKKEVGSDRYQKNAKSLSESGNSLKGYNYKIVREKKLRGRYRTCSKCRKAKHRSGQKTSNLSLWERKKDIRREPKALKGGEKWKIY